MKYLMCSAIVAVLLICTLCQISIAQSSTQPPNILWITCEDTGAELGCYGDTYANTPAINSLAKRGLRYSNCWSNAPVCAPARTTLITGLYPTQFGGQHMRCSVPLPAGTTTIPEWMQQHGYYCSNNHKEDYNFAKPKGMWDASSPSAHWRNRPVGKPFFSVFNLQQTHESQIRKRPYTSKHAVDDAPVPPYHPDTAEVRLDWAQYYDRITEMDAAVGALLQQLEADGLTESTIVFFFGDHGSGMPRSKRWLYQGGLRVGMVVSIPERYRTRMEDVYSEGSESKRLVSFVDLAPTVYQLAGIPQPSFLHGRSFIGPATESNRYLIGFRDRMDERIDSTRAIRDERYLYIRNFMPRRPQGTYLAYMFQTPTTQVWNDAFLAGELTRVQAAFWKPKSIEELYDLEQDPHQIHNLAGDVATESIQRRLSDQLQTWMLQTGDTGPIPEGTLLWNASIPYAEAIDAAWRSGDASADPTRCIEMLRDPAMIVRYWGAIASKSLMAKGSVPSLNRALASSLQDESPWVRIIAAEALCESPAADDSEDGEGSVLRDYAKKLLLRIAVSDDSEWGMRMAALNALCDTGCTVSEATSISDQWSTHTDRWLDGLPKRYDGYLEQLIDRLQSIAIDE